MVPIPIDSQSSCSSPTIHSLLFVIYLSAIPLPRDDVAWRSLAVPLSYSSGVKLPFTIRLGCLKECRIQMNYRLDRETKTFGFPSRIDFYSRVLIFNSTIERFAPFMAATVITARLQFFISPRVEQSR